MYSPGSIIEDDCEFGNMRTSLNLEMFSHEISTTRMTLSFDLDEDEQELKQSHEEDDDDSGISSEDSMYLDDDDELQLGSPLSRKRASPWQSRKDTSFKRQRIETSVRHKAQENQSDSSVVDIQLLLDLDEDANTTGDMSRPLSLPTISGKHKDLKTISPQTMTMLLNNNSF